MSKASTAWTCTVPGCDRGGYGRGMCEKHYQQVTRQGRDPFAEARGEQFYVLRDAADFIERSATAVRGWIAKGLLPDGPPWYPLDLVRARDAAVERRAQVYGPQGTSARHGTIARYEYGCRCEHCRAASARARAEQRRAAAARKATGPRTQKTPPTE